MDISHRRIIAEAWNFTQNNKKMIMVYAFLPAVFSTLAGILYLLYQYYAFLSSPLMENWERSFVMIVLTEVLQILRDNLSWSGPIIAAIIAVLIFYFLVPSFCEGAIIQMVARKRNNQHVRTRDGIKYGMMSFLPLFEYSWIVRSFSIVSMIFWISSLARTLGWQVFNALLPLGIFLLIVEILITIVFTYTEFLIVIDDKKVIESIAKSAVLVVTHLEETLLLSILMLIISVRILVQIVFVLLIPAAVTGIIYVLALAAMPFLGLAIGGAIGLILLYLASYLSGTIHVFAAAVWTFTFLELTKEENNISPREEIL